METKRIRVDLEEIYALEEARPRKCAVVLLQQILEYYQLRVDKIVCLHEKSDIDEKEVEELERKSKITIELFDGHETAIAFFF